MSQIFEFSARDFVNDFSLENSIAERRVITLLGKTTEEFILGNDQFDWSQLVNDVVLEPNTDYIFRFAVTGGTRTEGEFFSRFLIVPGNHWDDRYDFDLAQNSFMPAVCKSLGDDLLRVFEVPFHTEEQPDFRIMFISWHCVTKILPAPTEEQLAELPDCTYEEWLTAAKQRAAEAAGPERLFGSTIDLSGAVMTLAQLDALLTRIGAGSNINMSNIRLVDAPDEAPAEETAETAGESTAEAAPAQPEPETTEEQPAETQQPAAEKQETPAQENLMQIPMPEAIPNAREAEKMFQSEAEQRLVDSILRYMKNNGRISVDTAVNAFGIDQSFARRLLGAMLMMELVEYDETLRCYRPLRKKTLTPETAHLRLEILQAHLKSQGSLTAERAAAFLEIDTQTADRLLHMLLIEKRAAFHPDTREYVPI